MKPNPRQYARALNLALAEKSREERRKILQRFLRVLRANKNTARLGAILARVETERLAKEGITKVEIETVSPLSSGTKKEIESALGKNLLLKEKINPGLLAGIRILVNGEDLIDASAKRRLDRMFAK